MQEAAAKMKKCAPNLWDLVNSLLDAQPSHRRARPDPDVEMEEQLEREMDLGECGGDNMDLMDVDDDQGESDEVDSAKGNKKLKKKWCHVGVHNAALLMIVSG